MRTQLGITCGVAMVAAALVVTSAQGPPPGPGARGGRAAGPPPLVQADATERISDHVHVIPDNDVGLVPNVGIVVGSRATLVIDTGLGARNAETILREVARVSAHDELYLVTTHVHPEHDLGAAAFPSHTRMIRSRDQVAEIAESGLGMAKMFSSFSPLHAELLAGAEFRPADIVFDEEHALDLGGVRVRLLAMGFNHTRGDTAIFVEPDRVLFSGDVTMPAHPNVGAGSSVSRWLESQRRFADLQPRHVVPSHGPMGDASMIAVYQGILGTIARRVPELKQQGRSVDEVVATVQEELREAHGTSNRIATTIRTMYAQAP